MADNLGLESYFSFDSLVSSSPRNALDDVSDLSSLENDSIEVVDSSFIMVPLKDDVQFSKSFPLLPTVGSVIWPSLPKK